LNLAWFLPRSTIAGFLGRNKQRGEIVNSPFYIVDGEPFWGWDRMEMLESRLEAGGR